MESDARITLWRLHEKKQFVQNSAVMSFSSLRDGYLKSLAIKGFSENTLRVRGIYIGMFIRWCEANGIVGANEMRNETLAQFQEHLFFHRKINGQPLALSSQHSRLALIRLWFRWTHRQGLIRNDPTETLELPRIAYKLPTILTKQQMEKTLEQPNTKTFVGIRDRAILEVFYSTGIRRTELMRLKIDDLDRERGVLTIREGKGKRDRTVPIGERALFWLDQYLSRGAGRNGDGTGPGIDFSDFNRCVIHAKSLELAGQEIHSSRKRREKWRLPYFQTHHGDAYAGRRSRHPLHPGNARPRTIRHNPNLHPRFHPKTKTSAHPHSPFRSDLETGNR